ncbi:inorganic diphosphatase [Ignavibacteria bacterium CHB1]|mgnify:CR=1 FL=1|nr:MAG: inorganic diphosphatase [Chlorobiota bacterium]MCC6885240.1 inorganic diphosphatase [Ignavibacteriales bacterium]MCE7953357.1 inorganic diphosphatase [Chlorobi bacterium CHB7]MDL1887227.1 inorganic diphosphatase [Ignavibacteria bacterium CHB1]RIK47725.1 MAG: inorganic pyrophosphatase [Ignavibacteriota bacterium]
MIKDKFNPWHSVSPGDKIPDIVNGIIEIPKGTRAKYELDKDSGLLKLDRVLYSSVYYPANYGFIPQTYCDDKDPLDILILTQIDVVPLCIVPAKIIGVMRMLDNGEADDKIIAVSAGDPSVNHINDIAELPQHFISELRNFFEDYKKLENKTVVVEEFFDRKTAIEILQDSFKMYKDHFTKRQEGQHITAVWRNGVGRSSYENLCYI